jgi:hypothetical protein
VAVVVFDPTLFKLRFSEFAGLDNTLLGLYFAEACAHCNNTDSSRIKDVSIRTTILMQLTAHIAELASAPMVGRVSSVSIPGAVSTTAEYEFRASGPKAWFDQTKYGAMAWQLMSPYRHAIVVTPDD